MAKAAARFDPETITLMRTALHDAWCCLPPSTQDAVLKSTLAERILKSAAAGERDRALARCGAEGSCGIATIRRSTSRRHVNRAPRIGMRGAQFYAEHNRVNYNAAATPPFPVGSARSKCSSRLWLFCAESLRRQ